MNRRHFLGSLAALSAGMALDVDKLLWVPGRRTYFDIVRPSQWREMAITPATVARILGVPQSMIDVSDYPMFKLDHFVG